MSADRSPSITKARGTQHPRRRRHRRHRRSPRILAQFVAGHRVARLERRRRARGASHLLQLAGLRHRRGAPRGRRRGAGGRRDARARAAGDACWGAPRRVDMASAALVNGITSHTFDFDDTHLKTIIHPAGPVASAVLALAEQRGASGRDVIDALVLGIDVACRIGNVMYPDHYDRGWHITGSTGMLGAAAGCARLLGARRAADRDGARHRRVAAGRPARAVRHDDQALPSGRRGTRGPDVGAAREAGLHRQPARAGGAARLHPGGLGQARLERGDRRARRALRDLVQHLQAVRLRHRHPSEHRRLRAAARAGRHARAGASASSCACTRWCWS